MTLSSQFRNYSHLLCTPLEYTVLNRVTTRTSHRKVDRWGSCELGNAKLATADPIIELCMDANNVGSAAGQYQFSLPTRRALKLASVAR